MTFLEDLSANQSRPSYPLADRSASASRNRTWSFSHLQVNEWWYQDLYKIGLLNGKHLHLFLKEFCKALCGRLYEKLLRRSSSW